MWTSVIFPQPDPNWTTVIDNLALSKNTKTNRKEDLGMKQQSYAHLILTMETNSTYLKTVYSTNGALITGYLICRRMNSDYNFPLVKK